MPMTVLKGDLAVKQSIALIKAFKRMKDYLIENKGLLTTNETIKLTNLVNEHSNRLDKIEEKLEVVMDSFDDPSKYKHYLIRNGEKLEADVAYQEIIKSLIHEIRGQKVMLDFELAKIYGYDTRSFNQQVKRNIVKFPEDLMFQLTISEYNKILMSQNVTSNWGGVRKLPYAFTEQGIYMLMTVLKGDLATKQSLALVRAFKQMKDYLIENKSILTTDETIKLTNLVNEHSYRLDKIEEKLDVVKVSN